MLESDHLRRSLNSLELGLTQQALAQTSSRANLYTVLQNLSLALDATPVNPSEAWQLPLLSLQDALESGSETDDDSLQDFARILSPSLSTLENQDNWQEEEEALLLDALSAEPESEEEEATLEPVPEPIVTAPQPEPKDDEAVDSDDDDGDVDVLALLEATAAEISTVAPDVAQEALLTVTTSKTPRSRRGLGLARAVKSYTEVPAPISRQTTTVAATTNEATISAKSAYAHHFFAKLPWANAPKDPLASIEAGAERLHIAPAPKNMSASPVHENPFLAATAQAVRSATTAEVENSNADNSHAFFSQLPWK